MLFFGIYPHVLRSRAINNRPYKRNFIGFASICGLGVNCSAEFTKNTEIRSNLLLFGLDFDINELEVGSIDPERVAVW